VEFLKSKEVFSSSDSDESAVVDVVADEEAKDLDTIDDRLSNALIAAIMGDASPACVSALLSLGANPNHSYKGGKIGKVGDRRIRKAQWSSAPIHLACARGLPSVLKLLIDRGSKVAIPDASGNFPLHLAAGGAGAGMGGGGEEASDGAARIECVKMLFAAGVVVMSKDANKHTVVHAAARAGQVDVLRFALTKLSDTLDKQNMTIIDWYVALVPMFCFFFKIDFLFFFKIIDTHTLTIAES